MNRSPDPSAVPVKIAMTVGESARATPDFVVAAASESMARGETRYPELVGHRDFRTTVAAYMAGLHGTPHAGGRGSFGPDRFVATTGGTHALAVALRLAGGRPVAVVTPCWPGFHAVARANGTPVFEVPLAFEAGGRGSWSLDVDRLADAFAQGAGSVIVNTPNNPTGWVADEAELAAIVALARRHRATIVSDEIYHRFSHAGGRPTPSFHDVSDPSDRVVYVQTLSKNWAMTGWRVGWIEVPPDMVPEAVAIVEGTTHGVPLFVQRAAIAALAGGAAFHASLAAEMTRKRDVLCDALAGTGRFAFSVPDAGPFAFVTEPWSSCGTELATLLDREVGVRVLEGRAFGRGFAPFVRICFSRDEREVAEASGRIGRRLGSRARLRA